VTSMMVSEERNLTLRAFDLAKDNKATSVKDIKSLLLLEGFGRSEIEKYLQGSFIRGQLTKIIALRSKS
jgi:hypothetical protein